MLVPHKFGSKSIVPYLVTVYILYAFKVPPCHSSTLPQCPDHWHSAHLLYGCCVCPLVCRIGVTPDTTVTIDDTVVRPNTLTSVSQLGPSVSFDVIVFNQGPSTALGAKLAISWPLDTLVPSDSYILYPTSVSVQGVALA